MQDEVKSTEIKRDEPSINGINSVASSTTSLFGYFNKGGSRSNSTTNLNNHNHNHNPNQNQIQSLNNSRSNSRSNSLANSRTNSSSSITALSGRVGKVAPLTSMNHNSFIQKSLKSNSISGNSTSGNSTDPQLSLAHQNAFLYSSNNNLNNGLHTTSPTAATT
ncbi:unnamed protein product [[Candida] boidinii]|uniref:Unnamed protein product n=1 Tax=Candida boidinii TaxID=5477 RepID=A0A9W6T9F9_CANBO|nr:unnamed protein product [[Candida] boidinii]